MSTNAGGPTQARTPDQEVALGNWRAGLLAPNILTDSGLGIIIEQFPTMCLDLLLEAMAPDGADMPSDTDVGEWIKSLPEDEIPAERQVAVNTLYELIYTRLRALEEPPRPEHAWIMASHAAFLLACLSPNAFAMAQLARRVDPLNPLATLVLATCLRHGVG